MTAPAVAKSADAPADEYFGPFKYSAISVRMKINALGRSYHERWADDGSIVHDALLVESSYRAWAAKYPKDRWLAPTAFHLAQLYQDIQSAGRAQPCARDVRAGREGLPEVEGSALRAVAAEPRLPRAARRVAGVADAVSVRPALAGPRRVPGSGRVRSPRRVTGVVARACLVAERRPRARDVRRAGCARRFAGAPRREPGSVGEAEPAALDATSARVSPSARLRVVR